uniref:Secreted protein n=1 Tax=Panagrellus redivivus TaxID=6233 RepID=A0A7E4V6Z4_PANRE
MQRANLLSFIWLLFFVVAGVFAQPMLYKQVRPYQFNSDAIMAKRSNAELINGLIGMDLNTLSAVGKRSNAELINGLLGMNLNKLSSAGR